MRNLIRILASALIVWLSLASTCFAGPIGIFGRNCGCASGQCCTCGSTGCSCANCGCPNCPGYWVADGTGDLAYFESGKFKGWYIAKTKLYYAYANGVYAKPVALAPTECAGGVCR
jgi:hypothetical protein